MAKNSIAKKRPIAGFTLIELLVTIVIIGILVGIGTVSYNGIMKQNRQKDLENSLIDAAGKVQNYISKNNKLPDKELYLNSFCEKQYQAFMVAKNWK